ncbi:TPA: hypothetical protein ACTTVR_003777, partial [Legionella anisa]
HLTEHLIMVDTGGGIGMDIGGTGFNIKSGTIKSGTIIGIKIKTGIMVDKFGMVVTADKVMADIRSMKTHPQILMTKAKKDMLCYQSELVLTYKYAQSLIRNYSVLLDMDNTLPGGPSFTFLKKNSNP